MKLPELLLLYGLVGVGCAIARLAASHAPDGAMLDAALLAFFWPVYGPFKLMGPTATAVASEEEVEFLAALRRASSTPLGTLLPDEATARALARRLQVATGRIEEIDRLLARPDFSEEAALRRQDELRTKGASERALATAVHRIQNIRRLRSLRDRFARELDEVRELLAQLLTQAEVVRLAGEPDTASRDLVRELLCRVEGLEEVFEADVRLLDE